MVPTSVTLTEATRGVLSAALSDRADVVVLGEAVGKLGGVFRATEGLLADHGPDRVIDTPLSEGAVVGLAAGMALAGKRPVVELVGASHDCYGQLVRELATVAERSGGEWSAPVVVRAPVGQLPDGLDTPDLVGALTSTPGLNVVCPASPGDAAGLLRTALTQSSPTLILEPVELLGTRGADSGDATPFGQAHVVRDGGRVTLVSYGSGVAACTQAADALAEHDVSVGVVDLRSLQPLDVDTVAAQVRATGHVVFVHPGAALDGFAATVLQRVTHAAFLYLESPPSTAPADLQAIAAAVRDALQF